jgi:catechol 2,3-dioxygenase
LIQLKAKGVPITRIADHGISLGIYFRDPDGNGSEVYYESPRSEWPRQERIFAADMVNRGLFPGPWDAEIAAPQSA